jgi:hypothetical protein
MQPGLGGSEQHHEERGTLALRELLGRRDEIGRHLQVQHVTLVGANRGPGTVRGEVEERWKIRELTTPVRELLVEHAVCQPFPLPHGIVGVLDLELGQHSWVRCAENRQLSPEDAHGPSI